MLHPVPFGTGSVASIIDISLQRDLVQLYSQLQRLQYNQAVMQLG